MATTDHTPEAAFAAAVRNACPVTMKLAFPTEEAAAAVMRRLRDGSAARAAPGMAGMRVWRCVLCDSWHFGHRMSRRTVGKKRKGT